MGMRSRAAAAHAFEVLADRQRRRILDALIEGEQPVTRIVDALSVSQPLVSKHLRVLRDAGLVDVRAEGPRRLYRIRTEPLEAIDDWLEPYRALWADRFDALERHLDRMDAPKRRPAKPKRGDRR